jgi:enterochelin esterase-like enzyme
VSKTSRTQVWLEGLGDWAWPGRAAPETPLPPSWVPAVPPPIGYALAGEGAGVALPARSRLARRSLLAAGLLSALLAVGAALALRDPRALERLLGLRAPSESAIAKFATAPRPPARPLPPLRELSEDGAGSVIATSSFASAALDGRGSFIVYLPPGYYSSTTTRYPVLYLLHGRNGHADAFLEIGIRRTLDRLIGAGSIPPMIAVMVQDLPGLNNWRDIGRRHSATYVVEVQELIDRMLRTDARRSGRAIAGSSMGGFGAMHVALANPYRFAVVESWLGYFNNLEGELRRDAPVISRLGLHAFVYGAEADPVALPEEDPLFAEQLREAGAQAESAVFPGGHSLEKVKAHLAAGLAFAGSSLIDAQRHEAVEEAHARWRA